MKPKRMNEIDHDYAGRRSTPILITKALVTSHSEPFLNLNEDLVNWWRLTAGLDKHKTWTLPWNLYKCCTLVAKIKKRTQDSAILYQNASFLLQYTSLLAAASYLFSSNLIRPTFPPFCPNHFDQSLLYLSSLNSFISFHFIILINFTILTKTKKNLQNYWNHPQSEFSYWLIWQSMPITIVPK